MQYKMVKKAITISVACLAVMTGHIMVQSVSSSNILLYLLWFTKLTTMYIGPRLVLCTFVMGFNNYP